MPITKTLPDLPHINDVRGRSADDDALFEDLRQVLAEHGALSRFGITLLHKHFEVGEDEVMVEVVDEDARLESASPASRSADAVKGSIETVWRLDAPSGVRMCERVCQQPYGPTGPHISNHMPTS